MVTCAGCMSVTAIKYPGIPITLLVNSHCFQMSQFQVPQGPVRSTLQAVTQAWQRATDPALTLEPVADWLVPNEL